MNAKDDYVNTLFEQTYNTIMSDEQKKEAYLFYTELEYSRIGDWKEPSRELEYSRIGDWKESSRELEYSRIGDWKEPSRELS